MSKEEEFQAIHTQAKKLLKADQPEKALGLYRTVSDQFKLYRQSLFPSEAALKDVPNVFEFHDVILDTSFWHLYQNGVVYPYETSYRNIQFSPRVAGITPKKEAVIVQMLPPYRQIGRRSLLLGGGANYSHWLVRHLPRLAFIEKFSELLSLPLIVNQDLKRFQIESLQMLGIADEQLIKVEPEKFVKCRDLVVPMTPYFDQDLLHTAIYWLRRKFLKEEGVKRRRIYLSREDAERRQIINGEEVEDLLMAHGFEKVVPGRLPFREQIAIFSGASHIVGPHGAGFANILFAPEGCVVIDLTSIVLQQMDRFKRIANSLNMEHYALVSDKVKIYPGKVMQDTHDYIVDIEELKEHLKN